MKLEEGLTYEELERFLRNWRSITGEGDYDFIGMVHIVRACLINLADNATSADWKEVVELFEEKERRVIMDLANMLVAKSPYR